MAYEKSEAVKLVIEAGHRLVEAGLVARTWGNISARISDTQFVITPSGVAYDRLTEQDIVTVNVEDCSYEGDIKPSSEKGIHADCYRLRSDVNFVIHTHQLYATAFGVLGRPLRLRDKLLGDIVPNAEYGISSTKKLRENVAACVAENLSSNAVFMRGHGVLFLGKDCESCFDASTRLEDKCREKVLSDIHFAQTKIAPLPVPDELKSMEGMTVVFSDSPATAELSRIKGKKYPVIDDMAQIAGTDYTVLSEKKGWEKRAEKALRERNVVFIRGRGAFCTGINPEEAQAVATVLEKNSLSDIYAGLNGADCRLGFADAFLQRTIYKLKYSKLK